MSDYMLILEVLKFLVVLIGFYFQRKREKALIASLESYNQRLNSLENITSKKLED